MALYKKLFCIFYPIALQGMAAYEVIALQAAHNVLIEQGITLNVMTDMQNYHEACAIQRIAANNYCAMQSQVAHSQSGVNFIPQSTNDYDQLEAFIADRSKIQNMVYIEPIHTAHDQAHDQALAYAHAAPYTETQINPSYGPTLDHQLQSNVHAGLHISGVSRQQQGGYNKKIIISAIRHSAKAKRLIAHINQKMLLVASLIDECIKTKNAEKSLNLFIELDSEINALRSLGAISFLLKPEISRTIRHIEWPLLMLQLGHKNQLNEIDIEQIAWALQCHFENMHQYTKDAQINLPEGELKKVIDDYNTSNKAQKLYKSTRYHAVYAKRDLNNTKPLLETYIHKTIIKALDKYGEMHMTILKQHEVIIKKNGTLTEYYRSRENALARMAQGNLSIQTKYYQLNSDAQDLLDNMNIDKQQFTQHSGNLIQQDTHVKQIYTINLLAGVRPVTEHSQNIKDGAVDCLVVAQRLNQEGQAAQAMMFTDFCCLIAEKIVHTANSFTPLGIMADAAASILHAGGIHDLANSIESFRTKTEVFSVGTAIGLAQGVIDTEGIYNGLCNTVDALHSFAEIVTDCYLFEEAWENNRHDLIEPIVERMDERYTRIGAMATHLAQRTTEFVQNMPNISKEEWRQTGLVTGNFIGREAAQAGIIHAGLSGLGKIAQGLAGSAENIRATTHEFVLAAQLNGGPKDALVSPFGKKQLIESALTLGRSSTGAVYSEISSNVIVGAETQLIESAAEVSAQASQSGATKTAIFINTSKHGSSETAAASKACDLKYLMRTEVEQSGAVTLETAQKVWENSREFKELNTQIAELSKTIADTRSGPVVPPTASVVTKLNAEKKASNFYEAMRESSTDVALISENTGIGKQIIEQIKNHVFCEPHILDGEKILFSACEDAAAAWGRLINGNFVQSDLRLLQHEFAESLLMNGIDFSWSETHHTVNKMYNWYDNL